MSSRPLTGTSHEKQSQELRTLGSLVLSWAQGQNSVIFLMSQSPQLIPPVLGTFKRGLLTSSPSRDLLAESTPVMPAGGGNECGWGVLSAPLQRCTNVASSPSPPWRLPLAFPPLPRPPHRLPPSPQALNSSPATPPTSCLHLDLS